MIRAARRGRRVVRLKAGDPFVFGRGGEEALALRGAGIAFEIVPGVTSALAAPALAGIPVTHRGLSSAFLVVSGHDAGAYEPVLANVPPGSLTVVVLMGIGRRREIAGWLIGRGWLPTTPAAVVYAAGTPSSSVWLGSLAELGDQQDDTEVHGTIVIGDVVSLAEAIGGVARLAESEAAVASGQPPRRVPRMHGGTSVPSNARGTPVHRR
jgi:uroporphyrin-III C-methyltransferase/precorrin-2 dehydrogenase/sirohydrochlorin ferrochelatase